MPDKTHLKKQMLALLRARGPHKTCCPSEVARACYPEEAQWRAAMPLLRQLAASHPEVKVLQGGQEVDPAQVKGPIRLQLRPSADDL